jgi:MFS family permease
MDANARFRAGETVVAAMPLVFLVREPTERRTFSSDRSALRARGFWLAAGAVLFAYLALGVLEGVLPLHFAERLTQAEIGALYVGMSIVVATSAAAAGSRRPRSMVFGSILLAVAGISLAGAVAQVPLWLLALLLAALGIGIGITGSLGVLVESVNVKRIVTAMVVWSQIGIIGYLIGPLVGGAVAEGLGYSAIGVVPAAAGLAVLAVLLLACHEHRDACVALRGGLTALVQPRPICLAQGQHRSVARTLLLDECRPAPTRCAW